jgi:threonine dehydratase
VEKCEEYGATAVLHGENIMEAKRQAFIIASEKGGTYLNR